MNDFENRIVVSVQTESLLGSGSVLAPSDGGEKPTGSGSAIHQLDDCCLETGLGAKQRGRPLLVSLNAYTWGACHWFSGTRSNRVSERGGCGTGLLALICVCIWKAAVAQSGVLAGARLYPAPCNQSPSLQCTMSGWKCASAQSVMLGDFLICSRLVPPRVDDGTFSSKSAW